MSLNVVLFEPEIPGNTGNIIRTCMATGSRLHLIEPMGFSLDEKHVRRAGMDYILDADISIYKNWQDFMDRNGQGSFYYLSRYGTKNPKEFDFTRDTGDIYLVFGKESTGIDKRILKQNPERLIRLPMMAQARSLNLSNCAAIMVYEVLGQLGYPGLSGNEVLKGPDFLDTLNIDE